MNYKYITENFFLLNNKHRYIIRNKAKKGANGVKIYA